MKYPTVSALCEGVAGAIREKEGSTEKINPQDFVQRIENLQVGGTSESNIEYLDVSGGGVVDGGVATFAWLAKAYYEGVTIIAPLQVMVDEGIIGGGKRPSAVMIDFSAKLSLGNGFMSVKELLVAQGGGIITEADIDAIPRITKEQFYDLNTLLSE